MKHQTKILLSILCIEILISSIFLIRWGVQRPKKIISRAGGEQEVFLAFTSDGGDFKKKVSLGETFTIPVILNTAGKEVFAADAVIKFDPQFLKVLDLDQEKPGIQVAEGELFPRYFALRADNEKGEIHLSGSTFSGRRADIGKSFSGAGILGSISFRAKTTGETKIYFDFQRGKTTDSNVVDNQNKKRDLLEKAGTATIQIR